MPTGHENGTVSMPRWPSISDSSSSGSRTSRSSLLMKVMMGDSAADLQQADRLRFDAVGGVDDHQRGVHRRQHPVGVFREVLVARGVAG